MGSVGKGVTSALTFGFGGKFLSDQKKKAQQASSISSVPAEKVAPIEPEKEVAAPKLDDAAPVAEKERKRNARQRGRAATILASGGQEGATAKTTLGA